MSNEYIQMIEELKKDYRVAWNKMNKLRTAYEASSAAWGDVSEDMDELENKRENQIVKLKADIKKAKELNKNIEKKVSQLDDQMSQMRPDKIDDKIKKLKDERKKLNAEIKKYS